MELKEIYEKYKNIAVFGMSKNPSKAAHEVPAFLIEKGYNIIPINPTTDEILGRKAYKNILDIPDNIEILNVFRRSEDVPPIVDEAIQRRKEKGDIAVIWLQLGIINDESKKKAEENGIVFVQNKCMYQEYNKIYS